MGVNYNTYACIPIPLRPVKNNLLFIIPARVTNGRRVVTFFYFFIFLFFTFYSFCKDSEYVNDGHLVKKSEQTDTASTGDN